MHGLCRSRLNEVWEEVFESPKRGYFATFRSKRGVSYGEDMRKIGRTRIRVRKGKKRCL